MRHSRLCSLVLSGLICVLLSGCCGVQGDWKLKQIYPSANAQDFTIARVSFYPNGSFEALGVMDGKSIKAKGMYKYCCCGDALHLSMGDRCLEYKAVKKSCNRIEISKQKDNGEIVTAVMCRDQRCTHHECGGEPCTCACCEGGGGGCGSGTCQ